MAEKKIAVVTGGSSGIGKAAAEALAAAGCKVYELSRSGSDTPSVSHLDCDVTDELDVRSAVNTVLLTEERVDILVCCAGMGISGAVEFTDPEDLTRQINVNLFGTDRAVRAVLGHMREEKSGRIVIVSSVAAAAPIPFQTWYSASKAALNSYGLALANEVRPLGIGVSVVMPGDIKTGFTAARKKSDVGDGFYGGRITRSVARMERDEQNGLSPETAGKIIAKTALRRRAKPLRAIGLKYSAVCVLLRLLPVRLSQWVLYRMYGK